MRHLAAGLLLTLCGTAPAASVADAVALAQRYIAHQERQLGPEDRLAIGQIRTHLSGVAGTPREFRRRADGVINQLTLALARMESARGLTVAAAYVVTLDPASPRATNLLGAVLHATDRYQDAALMYEVTLAQAPDSPWVMLSLANLYLDMNRDADAKKLLDRAQKIEPDSRDLYKALALYWYKKGNLAEFHAALLKSSTFEGYVRRTGHEADQPVDANEVAPDEPLGAAAAKLDQLKTVVPLTTADIIEQQLPREARAIRDEYGRLIEAQQMKLPKFPQIKTNGARDYAENYAIVGEWVRVIAERQATFLMDEKYKMHVTGQESEAQLEAMGERVAQEQLAAGLQAAQDAMKYLKAMPGAPGMSGQAGDALKQVQGAAAQRGVKLADNPVDPDTPPGYDSGSVFAKTNYRNYLVSSRSYETYLRRAFADFDARAQDNLNVYLKKIQAEVAEHDAIQANLDANHEDRLHLEQDPGDLRCYSEYIRYRKAMNWHADTYYKLWVNLYIPQYTQKMKPRLEEYWRVHALYIRNMNDAAVMEREYLRIKEVFLDYAVRAATASHMGIAYAYQPVTPEEQQALDEAIAAATQLAQAEVPKIEKEFQTPAGDWVDWIGTNLVFEVSVDFLSLKITAHSIEFEAWAFGPAGGIKVDMVDETVETYVSLQKKFELGIKVAGVSGKIEGKVETAKRTAKWDFRNGTYEETTTPGAKGEVKVALGPVLSATTEIEIDAVGNAKIAGKLTSGIKVAGKDLSLSIPGNEAKP